MSLGVNLGVLSSKPSGDFASKMWASYTQLNPGVYSEAISTEFKRRMKPDYVENLVLNGGGFNATDWIDTNVDGLADGWASMNIIPSIVTGNGFIGNAHRAVLVTAATAANLRMPVSINSGVEINISLKYRSNVGILIYTGITPSIVGAANTGDAIPLSGIVTSTVQDPIIRFQPATATENAWIEIDEVTIVRTISQNYFTTFGPSGLNKTTADWIYLLTCSGNLTQESINKTGAVIKWNLDGSIISQNNPPIYTKGTNAGIITMTSTDGWSGVTTLSVSTVNYSGILPRFQFTSYGGATLVAWIICQMTGDININYGSIKPYIQRYYSNMFTTISGLSAMYSTNVAELRLDLNAFNTAEVDRVLAWINTYYATSPPIKNLTLNLSGATMGIPTGAGNNTDLLGILAKFATAGFTATIIVRTV